VGEAGEGDEEEERAAAALAAGVRLPRGFAIGSFSSRSLGQTSAGGSNPSLLQLLEREQQQQQQQQQQGQGQQPPRPPSKTASASTTAAVAAEGGDDGLEAGFADAYLDPPVPTADQLSLFMEVQRFVGRRRLAPVLHCVLTRMVFAMPFDDSIRITLDTDVRTTALAVSFDLHTQCCAGRPAAGYVWLASLLLHLVLVGMLARQVQPGWRSKPT
jgi:hypothetical protein